MSLFFHFKKMLLYTKNVLLFGALILKNSKLLLFALLLCFGMVFFIDFDVFINALLPAISILVIYTLSNHDNFNIYSRLYTLPIPKWYFFLSKFIISLSLHFIFIFSLLVLKKINIFTINLDLYLLGMLLIVTSALTTATIGFLANKKSVLYEILMMVTIINILPLLNLNRFLEFNLFNQVWIVLLTYINNTDSSFDVFHNIFYINGLTWLIFVIFVIKHTLHLKSS